MVIRIYLKRAESDEHVGKPFFNLNSGERKNLVKLLNSTTNKGTTVWESIKNEVNKITNNKNAEEISKIEMPDYTKLKKRKK